MVTREMALEKNVYLKSVLVNSKVQQLRKREVIEYKLARLGHSV